VKSQRSQILFYFLFSILFIVTAIYFISRDPFQWFKTKGNDFVVQWLAVRTFAKENLSPYMPVVQTTTEEFVYGNSVPADEKGLKFSSPLYSALFILPFALVSNVKSAQFIWMILSGIILMANAGIAFRLTGWKPPIGLLFFTLSFTGLGFYNLQTMASGSVIILSSLFVFSSLVAIRLRRHELAGILLAMATIQPRAVVLVIVFILVWSISKRLWSILVWFLAGEVMLIILGLFFIPDWPLQYLRIVFQFKDFYQVITPVAVFSSELPGMGRQLGWGLSLIMVIILFFEWLAARKKDFNWFLWTVSLTLVVSPWIGIPSDPNDFVLLILPLILILAAWDQRFSRFGKWMAGIGLLILLAVLWGIFVMNYHELSSLQLSRIFLFPMPFFLLIGLYWVRWWAIKPQVDFIEEISSLDRY